MKDALSVTISVASNFLSDISIVNNGVSKDIGNSNATYSVFQVASTLGKLDH